MPSSETRRPLDVKLSEFLEHVKEDEIGFIILNDILSECSSLSPISQFQEFLQRKSSETDKHPSGVQDPAIENFIQLSNSLRNGHSQFVKDFTKWKSYRQKLIESLNNYYDKHEINFYSGIGLRMLASAADIFLALNGSADESASSSAKFAATFASGYSVLLPLYEMDRTQAIFSKVTKYINEDKALFAPIIRWYKQFHELDAAIDRIFPYGVDKDVATEIYTYSENFENLSYKLFMAILASNVKRNTKLFKDEEFFDKAARVALSEAGQQWFVKVIAENDSDIRRYFLSDIHAEAPTLQLESLLDVPSMMFKTCATVARKVRTRITFHVMTVMSSGIRLLFKTTPRRLTDLRKLADSMQKQLDGVQKIVRMLAPLEVSSFTSKPDGDEIKLN